MILSFDIGGMSTKIGLINESFEIEKKDRINYPNKTINWNDLSKLLVEYIQKTIKKQSISSICFSCPGAVNIVSGEVIGNSAIEGLCGTNIKKYFSNLFDINVFVENDANCSAIAELEFGNAKNINNSIMCVVGTGIGGAIIIDKKIYRGSNYFAAEYGSMYEGELPEYLKNSNFPIKYKCTSFFGMLFTCSQYTMKTGKKINGYDLFKLYNSDKIAKEVIDNMVFGISKTLANIAVVIDPDRVIIGGGISENDLFIKLIKEKTKYIYNDLFLAKGKFDILPAKYKNDSNIIGAALLAKN